MLIRSPGRYRLIWYWYWVGGEFTGSPYAAKLLQMKALLTGGTLARAAAEGHRVVLVTATAGEAGLGEARDVVLEGLVRNLSAFEGILMCSMYMLPQRAQRRERIYRQIFEQGASLPTLDPDDIADTAWRMYVARDEAEGTDVD